MPMPSTYFHDLIFLPIQTARQILDINGAVGGLDSSQDGQPLGTHGSNSARAGPDRACPHPLHFLAEPVGSGVRTSQPLEGLAGLADHSHHVTQGWPDCYNPVIL